MSWILPFMYTISFFFPGVLEAYAAYKVFPFIKYRGGLVVFIFMTLSSQFDLLYSILIFAYLFINFGKLPERSLPWSDPIALILSIYLLVSLFLWRLASGSLALWFTGKLTERPIRRLLGIPEEDSQ